MVHLRWTMLESGLISAESAKNPRWLGTLLAGGSAPGQHAAGQHPLSAAAPRLLQESPSPCHAQLRRRELGDIKGLQGPWQKTRILTGFARCRPGAHDAGQAGAGMDVSARRAQRALHNSVMYH